MTADKCLNSSTRGAPGQTGALWQVPQGETTKKASPSQVPASGSKEVTLSHFLLQLETSMKAHFTAKSLSNTMTSLLARYTKEGFLHLGTLGSTTLLPDTRCLVDNKKSRLAQLLDCEKVKSNLHKRWNFSQNGALINRGTGRCLEVENKGNSGIDLVLRSCTGQRWTIKNFIK